MGRQQQQFKREARYSSTDSDDSSDDHIAQPRRPKELDNGSNNRKSKPSRSIPHLTTSEDEEEDIVSPQSSTQTIVAQKRKIDSSTRADGEKKRRVGDAVGFVGSFAQQNQSEPSTSTGRNDGTKKLSIIDEAWIRFSKNWIKKQPERERLIKEKYTRKRSAIDMEEHDPNENMYERMCWSLLGSLNADLCVQTFTSDKPGKTKNLRVLIARIHNDLTKMKHFANKHRLDAKFVIPEDMPTMETQGETADQPGQPWNLDNDEFDEDTINAKWRDLYMDLDYCLRLLCRLALSLGDNTIAMREIENIDSFATVNNFTSDDHRTYLSTRLSFNGTFIPRGEVSTNANLNERQHSLNGIFLVSLEEMRRNGGKGKFKTWSDIDRQLSIIVRKFVQETLVENASASASLSNTPVFLNISFRKNAPHFKILNGPGTGGDREPTLALLHVAKATYDLTRNIIAVKAYISCTMSAADKSIQ